MQYLQTCIFYPHTPTYIPMGRIKPNNAAEIPVSMNMKDEKHQDSSQHWFQIVFISISMNGRRFGPGVGCDSRGFDLVRRLDISFWYIVPESNHSGVTLGYVQVLGGHMS